VTDPAAVADRVEVEAGPVDLWCSNAGVALGTDLGGDDDWERSLAVNVLAMCTWLGPWRRGWRPGAAGTCC
jgi:NADP-dependent 3-hydroxy acid dehydrogenase YdfG